MLFYWFLLCFVFVYTGRNRKRQVTVIVNENSPVIKAFRGYQTELDTKHDRHERIVKLSRDITIESKRVIFLLQRCAGFVVIHSFPLYIIEMGHGCQCHLRLNFLCSMNQLSPEFCYSTSVRFINQNYTQINVIPVDMDSLIIGDHWVIDIILRKLDIIVCWLY